MPLSKARMRTRKRKDRLSNLVKPKADALQSTTRPLAEESNGKLPVKPKLDPPPRFDAIFFEGANNMDKPEIDADGEPIPEM